MSILSSGVIEPGKFGVKVVQEAAATYNRHLQQMLEILQNEYNPVQLDGKSI